MRGLGAKTAGALMFTKERVYLDEVERAEWVTVMKKLPGHI